MQKKPPGTRRPDGNGYQILCLEDLCAAQSHTDRSTDDKGCQQLADRVESTCTEHECKERRRTERTDNDRRIAEEQIQNIQRAVIHRPLCISV